MPNGIAANGDITVIVVDTENHRIRKITPHGHMTTLAGTGVKGHRDEEGTIAKFNQPRGLIVDGGGDVIIVADCTNHRIRKITPQGHSPVWRALAEKPQVVSAPFNAPVHENGNVTVADRQNHYIRRASNRQITRYKL
jgi:DNA-binding beta-propeller fold protein YncE